MTNIKDIPEGPRERLRGEILSGVERRINETDDAFRKLTTFMGIVVSGSLIAILGLIGQQLEDGVPLSSMAAFASLSCALLTFGFFQYRQFRLLNARAHEYSAAAQKFFTRKAELEDVLELASRSVDSTWNSRLIFWVPSVLVCMGFVAAGFSAFS